ncbi:MAG: FtsX-like permease family protein [Saprospiraceae bacterium]|nr:FtsX-like permease family protein [Saprospiraceae bacterium]
MKLILSIAARYLFGKKSTNAIHIITWISIVGMSIGTAALILILSVFNGFESLLTGMLSNFNPDIKVTLIEGKYISVDSVKSEDIRHLDGIDHIAFTLEETSFFDYKGSQEVGIIKGVNDDFMKVTGLDTSLITGTSRFGKDVEYGVLGSGMNTKLSVNPSDGFTSVTAYMPSNESSGPLANPFNALQFYASGTFSVGSDVDMQYVLVNFDAVNALLNLENHFSAIEIKLKPGASEKKVVHALSKLLGQRFKISNRYQQDEGFLKIMNIEKWISYLIACLTLLIIAFNLVGSLWMIVLEKKKDIAILKSMGLTRAGIKTIFLALGLLISVIGLVVGFGLGLLLYWLQKEYGLISIPDGFMIDAYPIEIRWLDFVIVACTVLVIGCLASLLPSFRAGQVSAFVRQE